MLSPDRAADLPGATLDQPQPSAAQPLPGVWPTDRSASRTSLALAVGAQCVAERELVGPVRAAVPRGTFLQHQVDSRGVAASPT